MHDKETIALLAMTVGEVRTLTNSPYWDITRVPGGWIYSRMHTVMGSIAVFVPIPKQEVPQ